MGAEGSRESRRRSSEETERLMQQNFAIAQRLCNAQRADRSKNDGILFAMGQHMFANMKKQRFGGAGSTDGRSIEIEGITYDLLDFIGKGGFGEVYKAQMRHKDHIVAIKVMKNSASVREEIEDEIRFLSAMRNISIKPLPIIKYFGTKMSSQTIHMAMELAACDLLKFWVDDVATADAERKFFLGLTIIVYVLRALTFLEKLEIIHGDIKPQNIVIVPRNNRFCVKLIDFGTLEKMDPFRAHLTVEADKPHTLFFASPEFIKRNEKNVMARRLHKTSDAWAAGVMFYFFLFERLPWKDQYEFDAFCNDPDAADIVVPRYGGFKHIIELLLKKNPEQRATAKATLMQVKDHPQLRNIIESLNEDFCPVDDVCHMRVSDDTRNELAKLARPGHVVRVVRPVHSGGRQRCKYGEKCFRHDRIHREDFAHPGDRDYVPSPIRGTGSQEIIPCRYASECHRFDTEHRQRYSHPDDREAKVNCRYGESCSNFDTNHRQKFSHPRPRRSPSSSSFRGGTYGGSTFDYVEKENCWFGTDCTDHHPEHRKRYSHPNGCDASRGKPACRYGSDCYDENRAHRSQYSHPKVRCHFGSNCNKMHDPEHRAEYGH